MITISLTTKEAIALHLFLANRLLLKTQQMPQPIKNNLVEEHYQSVELDVAQQKIAAELDNHLRIERIEIKFVKKGDRNHG